MTRGLSGAAAAVVLVAVVGWAAAAPTPAAAPHAPNQQSPSSEPKPQATLPPEPT